MAYAVTSLANLLHFLKTIKKKKYVGLLRFYSSLYVSDYKSLILLLEIIVLYLSHLGRLVYYLQLLPVRSFISLLMLHASSCVCNVRVRACVREYVCGGVGGSKREW